MTPQLPYFVWTPEQHEQLLALCRRYGVEKLWVFGSATTDRFDPARSDLDFQAKMRPDLAPGVRGDYVWALLNELPELFGRAVDLITNSPVENPFLRLELEETRVLLYDATREKVFV